MEKPTYPGVDYSDHGVAGNNINTLPREEWQHLVDLVKQCEKNAEDLEAKVTSEVVLSELKPFSSQLREGLGELRHLIGEV